MFEFTPKLLISMWLICTFVAILGCLYALIAAGLLRRFAQKCSTPKSFTQAASVLKPLYDTEPELEANLASFCRQEYGGEFQLIFGLHEARDPAGLAVERLKTRFPERDIVLSVDPELHGANRKISNLINMLPHASHDFLVLSDSDIRVEASYLDNVISALEEPGVGLVSCLYCGVPAAGIWSRVAAEGINSQFLPNALVGLRLGFAEPCFGATIALRRETLARIGGFEAFADQLADDYAMGMSVRRLGLRVVIPHLVVSHVCYDRSIADLVRHELRAARTIRNIDPWGYAGLVVTNPTRSDPGLAPDGGQVYYLLAPVPHLAGRGPDAAAWRNGLGERYTAELLSILEGRGYVGLRDSVEVSRTVTPAVQESFMVVAPSLTM